MKPLLIATVLALVSVIQAEDTYLDYDAAAIKRFADELRSLGVTPPAVTNPEQPPANRPAPTVKAKAGDFQGFWMKSQFGRPIAAFEGIPFAKPPVGPLRFKAPEALPRFPKPFNAVKAGSECIQPSGNGNEDCLFINVYTPLVSGKWPENKSLPVMFFVHGGGFVGGQGVGTRPGMLLEKDVLLVTSNYRLGALGFLSTEDGVIPGNLALKDQVAALRWTAENIASFGGNPNLVTVAGLSAGGSSTDFLKVSPLTKGLIHRAIAMSGAAFSASHLAAPGDMKENVEKAAKVLGCPAEPSTKLLACFQTKPAAEFGKLISKLQTWWQALPIPFKAVVEGKVPGAFLPEHPSKLTAKPANDIPYITGVTSEEGSLFNMYGLFRNAGDLKKFDQDFVNLTPLMGHLYGPKQTSRRALETLRRAYFGPGPFNTSQALLATKLFGDINYMWPAITSVLSHAKGAKSPVYMYYFDYKEHRNPQDPSGVGHAGDGRYLSPFGLNASPTDIKMALIYTDLYTNFARDGVPTTKLANVTWTPVTSGEKDMAHLHVYSPLNIQTKKNLFPERWFLLKTLLEDDPK